MYLNRIDDCGESHLRKSIGKSEKENKKHKRINVLDFNMDLLSILDLKKIKNCSFNGLSGSVFSITTCTVCPIGQSAKANPQAHRTRLEKLVYKTPSVERPGK